MAAWTAVKTNLQASSRTIRKCVLRPLLSLVEPAGRSGFVIGQLDSLQKQPFTITITFTSPSRIASRNSKHFTKPYDWKTHTLFPASLY
jgi:hypothetical protein